MLNPTIRSAIVPWCTVTLVITGACTAPGGERGAAPEYRGWMLAEPMPKPDFTLRSTDGEPFSFRKETKGSVTLLFFGYTYCPDVCPLHMANIAAVLKKLPPRVASQVKVVFVTTDAERDTPERLRQWLGNFDPKFIGLTGPLDEVNAIQRSIGLAASRREEWPDGGYGMGHSAQVIGYTKDDLAHVMYPFGTRQEDWAHDLPRLVEGPPSG